MELLIEDSGKLIVAGGLEKIRIQTTKLQVSLPFSSPTGFHAAVRNPKAGIIADKLQKRHVSSGLKSEKEYPCFSSLF